MPLYHRLKNAQITYPHPRNNTHLPLGPEVYKERLCLIKMQTGYSCKPPLGMRPGFILRNGMSTKDPILSWHSSFDRKS
jgi:hypothetical protein